MERKIEYASTIVSVVPFDIKEDKPGLIPNLYTIPGCRGKDFEILIVGQGHHFVYIDEDRGSLRVPTPSNEIARSLVEDYVNSQLAVEPPEVQPGIFWVPGQLSSGEVKLLHHDRVDQVKQAQKRWFINLCKIADDDWARYHQHKCISDFQRFAAHSIGYRTEEHEWLTPEVALTADRCPACAMAVAPQLVICPNCKCILNPEKYKELQFA